MESYVLLAEDATSIRNLVALIVESAGYRCRAFENGESALAHYCADRNAALVITDMRMPLPGDGVQLLQGLLAEGYEGRAIAMSAACADEEKDAAIAAGAEWVDKPFGFLYFETLVKTQMVRQSPEPAQRP